jgi:hypothetical protein
VRKNLQCFSLTQLQLSPLPLQLPASWRRVTLHLRGVSLDPNYCWFSLPTPFPSWMVFHRSYYTFPQHKGVKECAYKVSYCFFQKKKLKPSQEEIGTEKKFFSP